MKKRYPKRPLKPPPLVPHPNLVALRLDVKAAQEAALVAGDRWDAEATRLVNEKLQTAHEFGSLAYSSHECPESPTVQCVYFEDDDPRHDYCLFCGDPEERK